MMNRKSVFVTASILALALVAGTLAIAQTAKDDKPGKGAQPEMKLPPGWTPEDMQACMTAGQPGKMHEWLGKHAGTWTGKTQMWMAPGMEPQKSDCVERISKIMDGRYIRSEVSGEMPGMGPFKGEAITGFDNVTQKFVASWIDNMGTGIMNGVGELSKDGKTMTWSFTYNCPIAKKQVTMRQIETYPDADTMTLEMHGPDPKTGKEFKSMQIDFKRRS